MKVLFVSLMLLACGSSSLFASAALQRPADQRIGDEAARQIAELTAEKRARTPAQRKIDSQLLYALKQRRGETRGVPSEPVPIKLDAQGRTLVDITAKVSASLISKIKRLGVEVVSRSERYHTIRVNVALEKLERLAALKEVRYLSMPATPATHGGAASH